MTPLERLGAELAELADQGKTWPCASAPDLWFADDQATRAYAATFCADCPALAACAAYAEAAEERHGVWAGVDRTYRPPRGRRGGRRNRRAA